MNPLFESQHIKTEREEVHLTKNIKNQKPTKNSTPFIKYRKEIKQNEEQGLFYYSQYHPEELLSKEFSCVKDLLVVNGHQQARSTFIDFSKKSCDEKSDYEKFLLNFTSKCLNKRSKNVKQSDKSSSSPYLCSKVESQRQAKAKLPKAKDVSNPRLLIDLLDNLNLVGRKVKSKYKQSSHFI